MRIFRRLIAWSGFLAVMTVIGVGVFHFIRYRPRCVIVATHQNASVHHLSHDGARLVMCRVALSDRPRKPEERAYQPRLEVIDTATAQAVYVAENFAVERDTSGFNIVASPDMRYFLGARIADSLLVDWQNGQTWPIPAVRRRTTFVTETDDKGVTREREVIEEFTRIDQRSAQCQFSPHGRWLTFMDFYVVNLATRREARGFSRLLGFIKQDRIAVFPAGANQIRLWDMDEDRLAMTLQSEIDINKHWSVSVRASDDGRWLLIAGPGHGTLPDEIGATEAEVWDLSTQRRKLRIASQNRETWRIVFPREGTRFVAWTKRERDYAVSCLDLAADGDELTLPLRQPMLFKHDSKPGTGEAHWGQLAPDGELFVLARQDEKAANEIVYTISVIDPVARRVLWETHEHASVDFAPDYKSLFCGNLGDDSAERRDARTGAVLAHTHWSADKVQRSADSRLVASWDLGHFPEGELWDWAMLHLPAWCLPFADSVVVAETDTGRIRFRVALNDNPELLLSGDGNTLVTMHPTINERDRPEGMSIKIWDVQPQRAWIWGVAAALVAGVLLLLLRKWRVRTGVSSRHPASPKSPASVEA